MNSRVRFGWALNSGTPPHYLRGSYGSAPTGKNHTASHHTYLPPGSNSPDDGKTVQFIILVPSVDSCGHADTFQSTPRRLPPRTLAPLPLQSLSLLLHLLLSVSSMEATVSPVEVEVAVGVVCDRHRSLSSMWGKKVAPCALGGVMSSAEASPLTHL